MNFTYFILLCLIATTLNLVCCNAKNESNARLEKRTQDLKSIHLSEEQITQLCTSRTTPLQQEISRFNSKLQEEVSRLNSKLQAFSDDLFYTSTVYNNKKYLLSNFPYSSADDAMRYCTAFGGYLAEIDDYSEYNTLQALALRSPAEFVLIGGADTAQEDTSIFPRTGVHVKILDWAQYQPDDRFGEDCLSLWKENQAKMNDLCGFVSGNYRFCAKYQFSFHISFTKVLPNKLNEIKENIL